MYQQKQKELLKQYEKQEKKLKELKAGGKSTKQAVSTWGSPWPGGRFSQYRERGGTRTLPFISYEGCGFLLFPFSPGEANKGSPDSKAAEMPEEKPG